MGQSHSPNVSLLKHRAENPAINTLERFVLKILNTISNELIKGEVMIYLWHYAYQLLLLVDAMRLR